MLINCLKILDIINRHSDSAIHGRTRIQKTVHIMKHLGFDYDERFRYLFYGPYSYGLFDEIKQLRNWKVLEEKDGRGEYVYRVLEDGKVLLEYGSTLIEDQELPSPEIIALLEKYETGALELLSTYYYLIENGVDEEKSFTELRELKPDRIHHLESVKKLKEEIHELLQM